MILFPSHPSRRPFRWHLTSFLLVVVCAVLWCIGHHPVQAQTFNSGSNGSDGALNLTTPGIIDFDPVALGLDQDDDGVYHFTTITIASGVQVRLSAKSLPGPVFWLASGPVQIDGIIDLNGEPGQSSIAVPRAPAVPGAGGFGGGVGGISTSPAQSGSGPGGGQALFGGGGGAGHAEIGGNASGVTGSGGPAYGNLFLVPLVGGSGGGGGSFSSKNGSGGGAGGGAILIASSTSIAIRGLITALGGSGGDTRTFSFTYSGGGGSGGSIRLVAPTISVTGSLAAYGGFGGPVDPSWNSSTYGGPGSPGRIRVEAFKHEGLTSVNPTPHLATPVALFLPTTFASLRVVSVAGVPVVNPMGSFTVPDVTINSTSPVAVVIEARDIPLSAVVTLHLVFENAADLVVSVPQLTGTEALSQTMVAVTIPPGFSRGFVRATWEPPAP